MEIINYEEIKNTPIALEVAELKREIELLNEKIKICEEKIFNLYKTCKHTYKIDYNCSCGYDYYKVCTKCGHVNIS